MIKGKVLALVNQGPLPLKSQGLQRVENHRDGVGLGAMGIQIIDSNVPASLMVFGFEITAQCRKDRTQVQGARGRWGKSPPSRGLG